MNDIIKKLIRKILSPLPGQSLVEMAISIPILIFLLIGVFEVGWALRGYLVLVNANREITRFAIRPGYLDFGEKDPNYEAVLAHAYTTVSDQLPLDFTNNSTMTISYIVIKTGYPCNPDLTGDPPTMDACNCDQFATDPNYGFFYDDMILHPLVPGHEYYAQTFPDPPPSISFTTRLDFDELAEQLKAENNAFNCRLLTNKTGVVPSTNNVVITELFYEQPQLFGFPFISNPFTDPVPLYSHTAMRIVDAARTNLSDTDKVGPVCVAWPFIIKQDTIDNRNPSTNRVDILDGKNPPGGGGGGGDWGWLAWNPSEEQEQYLSSELLYGEMSLNDYTNANPAESDDHKLSVGDWVASLPGLNTGVNSAEHRVDDLVGQTIIIPVWDGNFSDTYGENGAYQITGFARVRIESTTDIDISGKEIIATYIDDASDACQ